MLERSQSAKHKLQVIDCDIHPAMTSWKRDSSLSARSAGSSIWRSMAATCAMPFPRRCRIRACRPTPRESTPIRRRAVLRDRASTFMQEQHLDPNGVEIGMLDSVALESRQRAKSRFRRGPDAGHEYLAAGALGQAGAPAEGFRAGRAGGHRGLRCRNRCPRPAIPRFRQIADSAAHRRTVRTAALLADLRSGRAQQPADRRSTLEAPAVTRPPAAAGRPIIWKSTRWSCRRCRPCWRAWSLKAYSSGFPKLRSRHHGGRPWLDSIVQRANGQALERGCGAKCPR